MSAIASRVASARLEEADRIALELSERDGSRYADIAARLGVDTHEVAELLTAARLEIRRAVRDKPVPPLDTEDCGRARPLLSARQDGETLQAADREFLREHVEGCESCREARMALREGSLAIRAAMESVPSMFRAVALSIAPPRPAPAPVAPAAPVEPAEEQPAAPVEEQPAAPVEPAISLPVEPAPEPPAEPAAATEQRAARQSRRASERAGRATSRPRQARRPRRAPAVLAVTVLAAFVATMTTIFVGGDDPATSRATDRPEATATATPTPSPAAADAEAAAERRAAARRRARARRERAAARRRRAAQAEAAATATATATPAPVATTAPEPEGTPAPERKRRPAPQQDVPEEDDGSTETGSGGAVIPQPQGDPSNPDGQADVIPDSCAENSPDCESG